ncbi:DUF72 domain-containing protein [Pseudomonas fluorescens]|uniref:DUF72 domain-containing protein n=1 Tax=Pseudomonas fluorescens group TaxID=136843 RepID=UPI0015E7DF70|nr:MULTISPECIES: DUF72 domain-containing protein [Pseudomonas fluorescens group]MBA1431774.1 DUF72 domain-containing protein [Pseudomonas orientalis]MBD8149930.1 DUF72 domain-containing protein [Pseudomonas fluorescens]MBD8179262.1 DUF72 domain-containing protein [Pseudomonas fluorescens]MBD8746489.1 DUF72 domain-containing protein [Pseudomonas fluorescens]MBD8749746.1 DUF72 domain-containing protein [Pseudomonas fluorescens]
MSAPLYVGCAGWSLPREHWPAFVEQGTHLQRYASRFNAVEINSSFYRPHLPKTYERWRESVPAGFRFSVKMPKRITHELRLQECETALDEFLAQCLQLDDKLGCLLVQLPPSLSYEPLIARAFFEALRQRFAGTVVLEPRHASWLAAGSLLQAFEIGWVTADPAVIAPGDAWHGVRYWRLHGSPRIYHSAYGHERVQAYARLLGQSIEEGIPTWCIFDNTASGHAVADALDLLELQS